MSYSQLDAELRRYRKGTVGGRIDTSGVDYEEDEEKSYYEKCDIFIHGPRKYVVRK
jgi:hypothetical protein